MEKQFEDNERMERMDVTFANKYISAYLNFHASSGPVSHAWAIPFQSGREKLTIMQHLLMGMNAHINLDLGTAAAETAPDDAINRLKNDFMKVNDILAGLTKEMQEQQKQMEAKDERIDSLQKQLDELKTLVETIQHNR